jgi:hypothetical protein
MVHAEITAFLQDREEGVPTRGAHPLVSSTGGARGPRDLRRDAATLGGFDADEYIPIPPSPCSQIRAWRHVVPAALGAWGRRGGRGWRRKTLRVLSRRYALASDFAHRKDLV